MKDLLIYDLKVVALIAVFYLLYRLLLHRSTLHRLNRMVLLGSLVLSLALPLCVITIHKTIDVSAENTSMGSSAVVNAIAEMQTAAIERPVAPVAKADVPEADEADAYYPLGNDMAAEYVVMDDVAAQVEYPAQTDPLCPVKIDPRFCLRFLPAA